MKNFGILTVVYALNILLKIHIYLILMPLLLLNALVATIMAIPVGLAEATVAAIVNAMVKIVEGRDKQ